MRTDWDYTNLADAYLKRPDYSDDAIDQLIRTIDIKKGAPVCDVGAGAAHLTLPLAGRGFQIQAVEPNDAMRNHGINRTKHLNNVRWHEGTGENTNQPASFFDLVSFGSSFSVTDRAATLKETARILKAGGWFACLWNHRVLEDPIQSKIEGIIASAIKNYSYGYRREDQTAVIDESGLFGPVKKIEGVVVHHQRIDDCIEAWRSHATLQRQAGNRFDQIIGRIDDYLRSFDPRQDSIKIPYVTRVWTAQVIKSSP
ncbi:MAG: class I SAM-dependent methyltransferase [Deltaproteobacteria bacterium]|nr:class I SAM-dependent methyltransferase [Deltaproteobacteria bacterium]